ncbi:MAG: hypothetical protein HY686_03270 [Chloroflexi bacterium]|nr:hypothetical protein [Chloroflexota bacterium]
MTTKYIVDEKGRRRGVVLSIGEYRRLLRRLEELEDALELDEAVRTAQGFADYTEVREELRRVGRL